MSIVEFRGDSSRQGRRKYWMKRTKAKIVRELLDTQDEADKAQDELRETRRKLNREARPHRVAALRELRQALDDHREGDYWEVSDVFEGLKIDLDRAIQYLTQEPEHE